MNPHLLITQLHQLLTHGQYYFIYHLHPPFPNPSQLPHCLIIFKRNPNLSIISLIENLSSNLQKTGSLVCSSIISASIRNKEYFGGLFIYFLFIFIITEITTLELRSLLKMCM